MFSVSVECCSGKLQRHINMAQTLHTSGIHYASTKLLNINFKSLNIALLRNVKNLIYSTVKYVCLHLDKLFLDVMMNTLLHYKQLCAFTTESFQDVPIVYHT